MYIYELKRGDLFKMVSATKVPYGALIQYHGMDGMYAKVTFGARDWNPMDIHSLNLSGGTEVCKFEESSDD